MLSSFGYPWVQNIKRRAHGDFVKWSKDYFFLGEENKKLVANVWYTVHKERKDIGLLGHVFTKPGYRRQGIATYLTKEAMQKFKGEGGIAMYLVTEGPIAPKIYESFGFRSYNGKVMRYLSDSVSSNSFDKRYFSLSKETVVDEATWGDLPGFEVLYNFTSKIMVRDYNYSVFTGEELEARFIEMMNGQENGENSLGVLRGSKRAVLGVISLIKLPKYEKEVGNLDFFIYPGYLSQADKLLNFSLEKAREMNLKLIRTHLSSFDSEKIRIVRECSFLKETILRDEFQYKGKKYDLEIFTKKMHP